MRYQAIYKGKETRIFKDTMELSYREFIKRTGTYIPTTDFIIHLDWEDCQQHFEFTPTEWEIIEHRLEADDAIYEAVFMDSDSQKLQAVTREQCYEACYGMIREGNAPEKPSRIEFECLKDAIEGGVFMAIADECKARPGEEAYADGITHGKYIAYCRAANRIEEKTGWQVPRT